MDFKVNRKTNDQRGGLLIHQNYVSKVQNYFTLITQTFSTLNRDKQIINPLSMQFRNLLEENCLQSLREIRDRKQQGQRARAQPSEHHHFSSFGVQVGVTLPTARKMDFQAPVRFQLPLNPNEIQFLPPSTS